MGKINRSNLTARMNEELDSFETNSPLIRPVGDVANLKATMKEKSVKLNWKDPGNLTVIAEDGTDVKLAEWAGTKIVRKLGSIPVDMNDGELIVDSTIKDAHATTGLEDSNVIEGETYVYRAFPYTTKGLVTGGSSITVTVAFRVTGPGSGEIIGGDEEAGFFGEVPNTDFITPRDLAFRLGVTLGTEYNNDTPWLKFSLDGKTLFVTKKPIKYSISWNALVNANVIYGGRTIEIDGKYYKVRLMKGASTNPTKHTDPGQGALGSEWNRLMYPIHIHASDKAWEHPIYVEQDVPDWGIGYTDEDLLTKSSVANGYYTWCQETYGGDTNYRVVRGLSGVDFMNNALPGSGAIGHGWRPVLELIERPVIVGNKYPGSSVLVAGDTTAGFLGEVPNTELITPKDLTTAIGLTAGTPMNEDTPWLKFILDGKILFVAKRPIRHTLSWNSIHRVGAVLGKKIIKIGDTHYKVRLLKGALTDPSASTATDKGAKGSEWNRLMLPIHFKANNKSWFSPSNVEEDLPNWGVSYTDIDLYTSSSAGLGTYNHCQETTDDNVNTRVIRGVSCASYSATLGLNNSNSQYGWRPVLEPVDVTSDPDDTVGTPGLPSLVSGDKTAGFFGEVLNAELITPTDLATAIGLNVGNAYNLDTPWLKFMLDGKILFVSKKPLKYAISWDAINKVGAVDGTAVITIGKNKYKVRLLKGATSNPYTVSTALDTKGSEWNRLMLPIHEQSKTKKWSYSQFVEDDIPYWGIDYTDADLLSGYSAGNGNDNWCQETSKDTPDTALMRGVNTVCYARGLKSSSSTSQSSWRPVLELLDPSEFDDQTDSPGNPFLKAGDETAGFYGEVNGSQLVNPTDLASTIGLTAGSAYNSDNTWLKFSLDSKILFVLKKPIRNNISWDHLNKVGAVKGEAVIRVGDSYYRVRLMKGALTDPYDASSIDSGAKGSEWNRLMLPIHIEAKDKSWQVSANVEPDVPYWKTDYTDNDLGFVSVGSATWCQETSTEGNFRVTRGGAKGVSYSVAVSPVTANSAYSWRPVLERIDPSEFDDLTGVPGSPVLRAGDMNTGFFGELPNTELITPVELAKQIGLNTGNSSNPASPWLKFIDNGKILFVAKQTLRNYVSWDVLNKVGAVFGNTALKIGNHFYKVRLLKGALGESFDVSTSDRGAKGSEWNRLMLPIHAKAKDKSWKFPVYVEDDLPDWGIGYTDYDLCTSNAAGNGSITWCQEYDAVDPTMKSVRGGTSNDAGFANRQMSNYNQTIDYGWRPVLELVDPSEVDDVSGSPGSAILRAGDKNAGFFGEIPNTELITPVNLTSNVGLKAGSAVNDYSPWLKFSLDGKILFVAMTPIRINLNWVNLNNIGAVYGEKTIEINGVTYKVRLLKGALTDPALTTAEDKGAKGSEWNRLLHPIHRRVSIKEWAYKQYVDDNVPDWGIGYSDAQLQTSDKYSICQETDINPTNRVMRGFTDASDFYTFTSTTNSSSVAWRPVLEVVEK